MENGYEVKLTVTDKATGRTQAFSSTTGGSEDPAMLELAITDVAENAYEQLT